MVSGYLKATILIVKGLQDSPKNSLDEGWAGPPPGVYSVPPIPQRKQV